MPEGSHYSTSFANDVPHPDSPISHMRYDTLDTSVRSYIDNLTDQIAILVRKYGKKHPKELLPLMETDEMSLEEVRHFSKLTEHLAQAMRENAVPKADQEAWKHHEATQPLVYDKEKAKEYGFTELTIEAHEKAQELVDAVFAQDPRFADEVAVKEYWQTNCPDLPDIPEKSSWFFKALAEHRLSDTIDNDNKATITNPTRPHIPRFGQAKFLLVMDWKEFDYDNAEEKDKSVSSQTKAFMKKLFNTENVTNISRNTINEKLYTNYETRTHTPEALVVIQDIIGQGQDPTNYELRLIRFDEYARVTNAQDYGKKNLWTHFDGYYGHGDGRRFGLVGGDRGFGGAARVDYDRRDSQDADLAVRLVLSRKV